MYWQPPKDEHVVYEALTAIADERIKMEGENLARCRSSSRNKVYVVEFDPETNAIMANDNMAYYTGSVSYPMIAYLMMRGVIKYDERLLGHLRGIRWKDINQKNKNDYMKSVREVLRELERRGVEVGWVERECRKIYKEVRGLRLKCLGKKRKPPKGY